MKKIRNNLLGIIMMYKTSFSLNPVVTVLGTIAVGLFVYSVAKIFGL